MEEGAIRKLEEEVVNRIAAGEIIQRPANVCKELMENCLDAKASQIHIVAKYGGLTLLQVEDNGTGIHPSNLEILCERFTTSKLTKFEDISKIHTFGFRGEALSSISHVAHLSVQTKTLQHSWGYRAVYENGKLKETPKRCAAKNGTIIRIEDLFYNMPQRRCCLHASEEYQKICDVVSKYAIHNAHIAFMLQKLNEQATIKTTIDSTKEKNIRTIYGARIADNLQSIEIDNNRFGGFKMKALITTNVFVKSQHFILFINHRLAESIALKNSIEKAYGTYLPKGMHPFVYVELEMNPSNIDVNVHPTKQQVHFLHEDEITEFLRIQIENQLSKHKEMRTLYKQIKLPGAGGVVSQSDNLDSLKSSPARLYEKDMVRTDFTEQKLETFLSRRLSSQKQSQEGAVGGNKIFYQSKNRTSSGILLTSIRNMQNHIDKYVSSELRKQIKSLVYVGTIGKTYSLFQLQTTLCLCNTTKLSEKLFYQLLIKNFQNIPIIKIEPSLAIKDLIVLALKHKHPKMNEIEVENLAEEATWLLQRGSNMMREYFSLHINSNAELEALPALLPNHTPSTATLPVYLLRLATKVDWKTEKNCFHTFAKETARYYASIAGIEFKTNAEKIKWEIEHIISPALKRSLQPPDRLKKYIQQLNTLQKLYRVFERC